MNDSGGRGSCASFRGSLAFQTFPNLDLYNIGSKAFQFPFTVFKTKYSASWDQIRAYSVRIVRMRSWKFVSILCMQSTAANVHALPTISSGPRYRNQIILTLDVEFLKGKSPVLLPTQRENESGKKGKCVNYWALAIIFKQYSAP